MDLRNHGRTFAAIGPTPMSYEVMATDVFNTLQTLSIAECHIVGHSMVMHFHKLISNLLICSIQRVGW